MFAKALGFIAGSLLFAVSVGVFLFRLLVAKRLVPQLPEFIRPDTLPQELIDSIQAAIDGADTCASESAIWLNALINWLFHHFISLPQPAKTIETAVLEGVVDIQRTLAGRVIRNVQLRVVDIGGAAPTASNVRIVTGLTEAIADPLTVVFDLHYGGKTQLLISLTLIFDMHVNVLVSLDAFDGPLCLVIRDRAFYLSVLSRPTLLLSTIQTAMQLPASETHYRLPFVDKMLSRWLLSTLILHGATFPEFVGKWFRGGPEQPPYPWSPSVLADPSLLYNWKPSPCAVL